MQITTAQLANELDTTPRTARKFLRSITERDAQPGKGSRWMIEKRELASLRKKFAAYAAAQEAKALAAADDAPETD